MRPASMTSELVWLHEQTDLDEQKSDDDSKSTSPSLLSFVSHERGVDTLQSGSSPLDHSRQAPLLGFFDSTGMNVAEEDAQFSERAEEVDVNAPLHARRREIGMQQQPSMYTRKRKASTSSYQDQDDENYAIRYGNMEISPRDDLHTVSGHRISRNNQSPSGPSYGLEHVASDISIGGEGGYDFDQRKSAYVDETPPSNWHHAQGDVEEEEEETKEYVVPIGGQQQSRSGLTSANSAHTSTGKTQLVPPVQAAMQLRPHMPMPIHPTPSAASETTTVPLQRPIINASRNITFEMLQPHFERPLQVAALHFGVCTTLLKKICRKNGIKNWPFRRICGLHKSIASMEKQVQYFDGEQKQSYAEQLYQLQLDLEAYRRTGNAPTPQYIEAMRAEATSAAINRNECPTAIAKAEEAPHSTTPSAVTITSPTRSTDVPTCYMRDVVEEAASVSVGNMSGEYHMERHQYADGINREVEFGDENQSMRWHEVEGSANVDPRQRQRFSRMPQQQRSQHGTIQRHELVSGTSHHAILQRTLPSLSYMLHRQHQKPPSSPPQSYHLKNQRFPPA